MYRVSYTTAFSSCLSDFGIVPGASGFYMHTYKLQVSLTTADVFEVDFEKVKDVVQAVVVQVHETVLVNSDKAMSEQTAQKVKGCGYSIRQVVDQSVAVTLLSVVRWLSGRILDSLQLSGVLTGITECKDGDCQGNHIVLGVLLEDDTGISVTIETGVKCVQDH